MNVFPYQPISYAMSTQKNNVLARAGPTSHTGYSMPPPHQQYLLPMPSFQQSTGGQSYLGQQVNTLPDHLIVREHMSLKKVPWDFCDDFK